MLNLDDVVKSLISNGFVNIDIPPLCSPPLDQISILSAAKKLVLKIIHYVTMNNYQKEGQMVAATFQNNPRSAYPGLANRFQENTTYTLNSDHHDQPWEVAA
jgi:hypothetical protein